MLGRGRQGHGWLRRKHGCGESGKVTVKTLEKVVRDLAEGRGWIHNRRDLCMVSDRMDPSRTPDTG